MRTVKVKMSSIVDREITLEYETEAIIENDDDVGDEGEKAGRVIREFSRGIVRGFLEGEDVT